MSGAIIGILRYSLFSLVGLEWIRWGSGTSWTRWWNGNTSLICYLVLLLPFGCHQFSSTSKTKSITLIFFSPFRVIAALMENSEQMEKRDYLWVLTTVCILCQRVSQTRIGSSSHHASRDFAVSRAISDAVLFFFFFFFFFLGGGGEQTRKNFSNCIVIYVLRILWVRTTRYPGECLSIQIEELRFAVSPGITFLISIQRSLNFPANSDSILQPKVWRKWKP